MKYFDWDENKNILLKETRNISFEEVVLSIANNKVLEVLEHPNKQKYPSQKMLIVEVREYAFIVPFVEDNERYFLKTIYPAREATKKYLSKDKED
jgi:uncharacterized DUF497 family protein